MGLLIFFSILKHLLAHSFHLAKNQHNAGIPVLTWRHLEERTLRFRQQLLHRRLENVVEVRRNPTEVRLQSVLHIQVSSGRLRDTRGLWSDKQNNKGKNDHKTVLIRHFLNFFKLLSRSTMLCSLPVIGQILTLPVIHYLGCGTGAATCLEFTWCLFNFFLKLCYYVGMLYVFIISRSPSTRRGCLCPTQPWPRTKKSQGISRNCFTGKLCMY